MDKVTETLSSAPLVAKAFVTYYVVAAAGLYHLFGRMTSPNKRLKRLVLTDLENNSNSSSSSSNSDADKAPTPPPEQSSPERARAGMARKLSFLERNPHILDQNPFMNRSWEVTAVERLKCALCGPVLVPVRVAILFGCVLGAYFYGSLSSIGADLSRPLPYWRIVVQKPMKLFARGIMFGLGFVYVKTKGRKATPQEAPIVCANHIGFVDAIYLPGRLLSMAVSRQENSAIPVFGAMMKQLQTIFVSRTDKDSRTTVAREIERRTKTERGQWNRQLLIFPEGTTTNGTAVISFKVGAFAPGVPVQPVSLRYPMAETCDPSWVTGGPPPQEVLLKLLCQPFNSLVVHFLPVHVPTTEEQADPVRFAENVRRAIAADLGVPVTDHGFDDVLMLMEAKKLGYQGSLKECVTELKSLRKILEIDLDKAKQYLQGFASLDESKRGRIGYSEFIKTFGSKDSEELRTLFSILDVRDRGTLNLAEYMCGLALLNEQGTDKFEGAMKLAFKVYDSSGNGHLSKADLARLLRRVCPADVSESLVDETFASADVDKDGQLSPEEFLQLANRNRMQWSTLKTALFR